MGKRISARDESGSVWIEIKMTPHTPLSLFLPLFELSHSLSHTVPSGFGGIFNDNTVWHQLM